MRTIFLSIAICLCFSVAEGQQHYPIFTQNYSNPFLINPSLITMGRRAELNAMYRQQWTGIQDAPETMQLDFQYPVGPRISLGVNLYNDKTILLSSSGALATFGYRVRLSSRHILGFGLSGGFVSNQIDLDDVPDLDLVDPVLLNSTNNFAFDGQFGLHYRIGGFILGASLLKLVDNRPFTEGSVESQKFDPFKDRAGFMTYNFHLSPEVSLQPVVYYRSTFTGYEYLEGSLLVNIKNFVTIGGGYRTELGPHAVLRIRFKNAEIGYAYDFPSSQYGGSTGGTNEVQLKLQFGREAAPIELMTKSDSVANRPEGRVVRTEPEPSREQPEQDPLTERKTVEPEVVQSAPSRAVSKVEAEEKPPVTIEQEPRRKSEDRVSDIPEEAFGGNIDYQLVVGVYSRKAHADRYMRQLNNQGFKALVLTSNDTDYYYVILPEHSTKAITLQRVLEIRETTPFKDAWFKAFQ